MARTFLSESTRRNAAATRSGLAPPPMSRKLAGSPPACWIMSMVAMASPAPLMMRSEEHTSELQSRLHLVCRLLLEKKKELRVHQMSACRVDRGAELQEHGLAPSVIG